MNQPNNIVFFDGICSLCNGLVDYLMKKDKKGLLYFASLQGETAKQLLPNTDTENLKTIIYLKDDHLYKQSNAVLEIFKDVKCSLSLLYSFKIIPPFIRDKVYRYVAENRYKWFGKKETCRMPTPQEKGKLLK